MKDDLGKKYPNGSSMIPPQIGKSGINSRDQLHSSKDIDSAALREELLYLLNGIQTNLRPFNSKAVIDLAHQLKGLTGLAGDAAIIDQCVQLNDAALEENQALVERISTGLLLGLQD